MGREVRMKTKQVKTSGITRDHIGHIYQAYYWLAELGDEYAEQAEALRDIQYFLQNILDIEEGIEQGYLEGVPSTDGSGG